MVEYILSPASTKAPPGPKPFKMLPTTMSAAALLPMSEINCSKQYFSTPDMTLYGLLSFSET